MSIDLSDLSITTARTLLDTKKITSQELCEATFSRIEKHNPALNCYITQNKETALKNADAFDKDRSSLKDKPLAGIPISVKDVFCTKDLRTTCASRILEDFIPPYESTVTKRLMDSGAIIVGKTNLDEFCHGSSTETSAFGVTKNPWDTSRLPGGSSGGSAAAVAADLCVASVGTETAGSIRQPASWCGVVGLKPTYGRTSRYGVIAMASSLDSPGPLTKNVYDAALLLSIIAGKDPHDATTLDAPVPHYHEALDPHKIKGFTIGIPKEFIEQEQADGTIEFPLEDVTRIFTSLGAHIKEISLLDPKYAVAAYTILARSEISSNLARFSGTRYSTQDIDAETYRDYFNLIRGGGFGDEPKRRIMTGTFALSSGYQDKYYKKAIEVQKMYAQDFERIFKDVDVVIGPTTPSVAQPLGSTEGNPLYGELADMLLEPSTLAHLPGISIPCGFQDNLPVGLQIVAPRLEEQRIIDAAAAFEQATDWHTRSPQL